MTVRKRQVSAREACLYCAPVCLGLALMLELLPGSIKLLLAPGPNQMTVQGISHLQPMGATLVFPPVTLILTVLALAAVAGSLRGKDRGRGERIVSLLLNACAILSEMSLIVLAPGSVSGLTVVIVLLLVCALLLQVMWLRR